MATTDCAVARANAPREQGGPVNVLSQILLCQAAVSGDDYVVCRSTPKIRKNGGADGGAKDRQNRDHGHVDHGGCGGGHHPRGDGLPHVDPPRLDARQLTADVNRDTVEAQGSYCRRRRRPAVIEDGEDRDFMKRNVLAA